MRQKKLWMLAAVATALMMTACGDSAQKELRAKADQLMEAAHQSKDYGKLLTMADSLEKTGNLSTVKANYWRGYAYDRQKQKDMAERYWRASMEAGENSDDARRLERRGRDYLEDTRSSNDRGGASGRRAGALGLSSSGVL